MHNILTVDLEKNLLEANRKISEENHALLLERGIKSFDFVGAIGSGKTLVIEKLMELYAEKSMVSGAIAGDVAGTDDRDRFLKHTAQATNINTGKECHLDAHLVDHAFDSLDLDKIDILFIENVGNLVCPADFPLGTDKRVIVISVTEGDDMVRKHPNIFRDPDIIVINKIDIAEYIGVDPNIIYNDAVKVNPRAKIIFTNAASGEGIEELADALLS